MKLDHLVIPAAGLGTRVEGIASGLPKEMLDIDGRPAIRHAVEEGVSAGIRNIAVVISRAKDIIRGYFEEAAVQSRLSRLRVNLCFFYQNDARGEADAIGLAEGFVGKGPLAVLYPDNIFYPLGTALKTMKDSFERCGRNLIALIEVTEERSRGLGNTGRVDVTPLGRSRFRVNGISPKETGAFQIACPGELRACGLWIGRPGFFSLLHRVRCEVKGGEFTDGPLKDLIIKQQGLWGVLLPGTCFDIGFPEGYSSCRKYFQSERAKRKTLQG